MNVLRASVTLPAATDGALALINHESILDRCWQTIDRHPERLGIAAQLIDEEYRRSHFLGDTSALDRLLALSETLLQQCAKSGEAYVLAAQIASLVHKFDQATQYLVQAKDLGAPAHTLLRQQLSIDHAIGHNWKDVFDTRLHLSEQSPNLQNLVALGALYAEMGLYPEAERSYMRAIAEDREHSPFSLAWACFQLGVLFGETLEPAQPATAQYWYEQALSYMPPYTHARVHLAELHLDAGRLDTALNVLLPIQDSEDPEVSWRLAQLYEQKGEAREASHHLARTQQSFERVLGRHELAFADHAVDFYLEEGDNPEKALQLATLNLNNRATLRAFELSHEAALACGQQLLAQSLADRAALQWGHLPAFEHSNLSLVAIPSPNSALSAALNSELSSAANASATPTSQNSISSFSTI
ncbi:MAG: tetratricopeptide repeat protein [Alcaligenaceae bacterium]